MILTVQIELQVFWVRFDYFFMERSDIDLWEISGDSKFLE